VSDVAPRLPILAALGAACLFGASTPAAKSLVGEIHPVLLAGLLYAGSGVGLTIWIVATRTKLAFRAADLPWLAGAVAAGGVAGPILLMAGLLSTSAASASLLLNLEGVFTALLAWFVFRENFDRRIALGMGLIVAGGVLLAFQPGAVQAGLLGSVAVAGACLAWAVDNNLTRRVSGADASVIAAIKGLVAGAVNLAIAAVAGAAWPGHAPAAAAAAVGLFGYGVSLALFVVALRELGAARAGAYFSTAPFVGVALALAVLGESPAALFWPAAALMLAGVWLHVTERHEHEHVHEPTEHEHQHMHDAHHQHSHDFAWDGKEPHAHAHRHARLVHRHPHYPDLHHRHH
jgi:drug/metabolite transporter (DMT)-like permease